MRVYNTFGSVLSPREKGGRKFFHIAESNEFFMRPRRGCEKAYENLRRKHTPSFGDLIIGTAPLSPAAPEKRAAYRRVSAKILP